MTKLYFVLKCSKVQKKPDDDELKVEGISVSMLLKTVPLATRRDCWFMHDGAPAHFYLNIKQFVNNSYPQK